MICPKLRQCFLRYRSYQLPLNHTKGFPQFQCRSGPRNDLSKVHICSSAKYCKDSIWFAVEKRTRATFCTMTYQYPDARRDESVVEDYHGTKVCDPYRWMEDPDAEETKKFVDSQNEITTPFLAKCAIKQKMHDSIKEMWDYPKYTCPGKHGPRYFYYYNTGLQNQSVLYVQDSIDGEAHVFLDPNKLSEDGTSSLRGTAYSEDGKYFAYGVSHAGSDWVTIKFKNAETEEDLPDTLERVKFSSMAWTHDNEGFFYNMFPDQEGKTDGTETTGNFHQKLYYHKLGTGQKEDVLCAEFLDHPKWMCGVEVSDCGRYIVASIREGCDPVNRLWYCDMKELPDGIKGLLPFKKVVDNFDAEYEYVTNEGTVFTFKTNKDAPRYNIINIDLSKPDEADWHTLVAEHEHDVLEWTACVNKNKLVLCYLHDVKNVMYLYDLSSGTKETTFPLDIGSVVGYSGKKKDTEIFYNFMSFITPGIIYRCDLTKNQLAPIVFRETKVKNFETSQFKQSQVFYTSKDGTKIPMFIIHKKDIPLDSNRPVFLYGYGGFNISITPYFSVSRTIFMKHFNGVYAVPNIRGGGEYGETWHKAGCFGKKQNVFDDFHAAAKYLIDNKYTTADRITINGGSNGGLLVGACANQRPDLYGCVIAQVGVMDMLRFQKFTIGHAWTTDFGCSDNKEDFDWLMKYSPLHNICLPDGEVQYPATLLMTGDHDDRVVPLHSLKFIAQLQKTVGCDNKQKRPLMIRIDTKSGHGAGKPTSKIIEELTDVFSFIQLNLNLEWQD